MLHFSNKEVFNEIMTLLSTKTSSECITWANQFSGFQSMNSDFEAGLLENSNEPPCEDDFLGTVLNKYSMIWIDSSAFLLDWGKDSIFETYPVNSTTITALQQKQEVAENINFFVFRYPMSEEVLNPSSGTMPTNRAFRWVKKLFTKKCEGDNGADRRKADDGSPKKYENYSLTNKNEGKYKYKLIYQLSGIWFSLHIKVKHWTKDFEQNAWHKSPGRSCLHGDYEYKKFCGGSDNEDFICYSTNPFTGAIDHSTWNLVDYKWQRNFYAGMTKLAKYRASIDLYMENTYNLDELFTRLEIKHNM